MAKFDGICPRCSQPMKPIVYGYGVGGCRPAPASFQCLRCNIEISRDGVLAELPPKTS